MANSYHSNGTVKWNDHTGNAYHDNGGQTLGALNYGKDKLKLFPDFAKFVIDKVVAINVQKIY